MRKPLGHQQEEALSRMREVLQEDLISLSVAGVRIDEDFEKNRCAVVCTVVETPAGTSMGVESDGVGLIDAFFNGLRLRYETQWPSLNTIRFTGFQVTGLMADSSSNAASDAKADATVTVTNSYGHVFEFGAITTSVAHSSIESVLAAVEYFVNSEKAYVRMYRALSHYRKEGRTDLVAKYTDLLSNMVRNTSYSEVIEQIRNGESPKT